jgi:hypothetical protein
VNPLWYRHDHALEAADMLWFALLFDLSLVCVCVCGCMCVCVCVCVCACVSLYVWTCVLFVTAELQYPIEFLNKFLLLIDSGGYSDLTIHWSYCQIKMVLQWCYSGVTIVLLWCHSGVTVVLQDLIEFLDEFFLLLVSGGLYVLLQCRVAAYPVCTKVMK